MSQQLEQKLSRFDASLSEQLKTLQGRTEQLMRVVNGGDGFTKGCACNEWGLCCFHSEVDYQLAGAVEHLRAAQEQFTHIAREVEVKTR